MIYSRILTVIYFCLLVQLFYFLLGIQSCRSTVRTPQKASPVLPAPPATRAWAASRSRRPRRRRRRAGWGKTGHWLNLCLRSSPGVLMYHPVWRLCRTIYGRKNKYISSFHTNHQETRWKQQYWYQFSDSKLIRLTTFSDCVDKTGSFCSFCLTYNIWNVLWSYRIIIAFNCDYNNTAQWLNGGIF